MSLNNKNEYARVSLEGMPNPVGKVFRDENEKIEYSIKDLEDYLNYKRLLNLSDNNDVQFHSAMNIVRDRVVKKLIKNR